MRHEGFLQAICEQPGEDAPRLIYADWLDDAGDAARAELIRLQCQRATLDPYDPAQRALFAREAELLALHADAWTAELPRLPGVKWGRRPAFERGFVTAAEFSSGTTLRKHLATLQAATPLTRVTLLDLPANQVEPLASWDGLARVRGLTLRNCTARDALVLALSQEVETPALDSLDLSLTSFAAIHSAPATALTPDALRALAQAPAFARLEHLDLLHQPWTGQTMMSLAGAGNFRGLRSLRLNKLWGGALHALHDCELPAIRSLHLGIGTHDPDADIGPLLGKPWFASVRRLTLPEVHHVLSRGSLVKTLFRSPHLSDLRCLDLSKTQLYNIGEVGNAAHLSRLVCLRLGESGLYPDKLESLMNSMAFPELRELHLDWATLEPAHLDIIANRTGLPRLELLAPGHAKKLTLSRYYERCPDLALAIGSNVPSPYL